jgi:hypothetical protein
MVGNLDGIFGFHREFLFWDHQVLTEGMTMTEFYFENQGEFPFGDHQEKSPFGARPSKYFEKKPKTPRKMNDVERKALCKTINLSIRRNKHKKPHIPVGVLCKRYGISETTFYRWSKECGLETPIRGKTKKTSSAVKRKRARSRPVPVVKPTEESEVESRDEPVVEPEKLLGHTMSLAERNDRSYLLETVARLTEECNSWKKKYELLEERLTEDHGSWKKRYELLEERLTEDHGSWKKKYEVSEERLIKCQEAFMESTRLLNAMVSEKMTVKQLKDHARELQDKKNS